MVDPLLMTTARRRLDRQWPLTNATSFFFERDGRLFLVTSRHVMVDEAAGHFPDRIEIELHDDPENIAKSIGFSIPLSTETASRSGGGERRWGAVDVAVIELERPALPKQALLRVFSPDHLIRRDERVEIGASLLIVGFPLGFHDTLHHMAVVRQAALASSYGLRFQGMGYFLTDARTHRGTSGAPVVMRMPGNARKGGDLPWRLLGVHGSRLDMGARDPSADEALGLNIAWFADILLTLTVG